MDEVITRYHNSQHTHKPEVLLLLTTKLYPPVLRLLYPTDLFSKRLYGLYTMFTAPHCTHHTAPPHAQLQDTHNTVGHTLATLATHTPLDSSTPHYTQIFTILSHTSLDPRSLLHSSTAPRARCLSSTSSLLESMITLSLLRTCFAALAASRKWAPPADARRPR